MKKLIFSLVLGVGLALNSFGAALTHNVIQNIGYITNIFVGPAIITSLEIINGSAVSSPTFTFYDSPTTNATLGPAQGYFHHSRSNGAYITYSSYTTNIARLVTNFSGLVRTQTYSGLWTYPVTNAATTNQYRRIYTGTVPAGVGQALEFNVGEGIYVSRGLSFTNSGLATNTVINITYSPAL